MVSPALAHGIALRLDPVSNRFPHSVLNARTVGGGLRAVLSSAFAGRATSRADCTLGDASGPLLSAPIVEVGRTTTASPALTYGTEAPLDAR